MKQLNKVQTLKIKLELKCCGLFLFLFLFWLFGHFAHRDHPHCSILCRAASKLLYATKKGFIETGVHLLNATYCTVFNRTHLL